MSWITRRELARLERELSVALKRAEGADKALAEERQRHDWLILQLTNRVVTKNGGYALDEVKPTLEPPKQHPRGFTHEPDEDDVEKLKYYKKCYQDAGMDEGLAEARWEAEMRGEYLPPEIDQHETEQ